MTPLGRWLRQGLDQRGLTLARAAVFAGVGQATLSDILNKGHIPKVETLFRLADYFGTSRERVLRLAADLSPDPGDLDEPSEPAGEEDALIGELLEEFRRLPAAWKQEAITQVAFLNRLAQRPAVRLIGEADEGEGGAGQEMEGPDAGQRQERPRGQRASGKAA